MDVRACVNNVSLIGVLLKILNFELFVGIQIEICRKTMKLKIDQQAYVKRILKRFNQENSALVLASAEKDIKFIKLGTKSEEKFPYRHCISNVFNGINSTSYCF